mmetsp:Transcript_31302/g.68584  ORF Transcript_31302/g.68584 Transcript_31302/m.68584 type:complete len:232 (+) Transcript_31302:936-1631(+)
MLIRKKITDLIDVVLLIQAPPRFHHIGSFGPKLAQVHPPQVVAVVRVQDATDHSVSVPLLKFRRIMQKVQARMAIQESPDVGPHVLPFDPLECVLLHHVEKIGDRIAQSYPPSPPLAEHRLGYRSRFCQPTKNSNVLQEGIRQILTQPKMLSKQGLQGGVICNTLWLIFKHLVDQIPFFRCQLFAWCLLLAPKPEFVDLILVDIRRHRGVHTGGGGIEVGGISIFAITPTL